MPVEIVGGAEVRFRSKDDRERLGEDFRSWIQTVEDDRRRMILEVYNVVQENLDGRAPIKSFPWLGASNVFAPLTGTYADAMQARMFQAATAHDPTNLVLPRGVGEVIPGVDHERWANWLQRVSRWIERDEIDSDSVAEQNTLTFVYYGDSYVYLPWEESWIADIVIKKGGAVEAVPRKAYEKVVPKVLHPKDVYIRWDAVDLQQERLVGFQWDLDLSTLGELEKAGYYDEEVAEAIRKKLLASPEEEKKNAAPQYFRQYGQKFYTPDEYEQKQKQLLKLAQESGTRSVKMLKMFARVDMDNDGVAEDTIFDVVKETGEVAYARYANYAHRERPLIHYWFKKRPGAAYNIGIGEMMINPQDIVNNALRDHFDNNKVQNTSINLIKKNSGIKKGKRFYPSATYYVNDPKNDVVALKLGAGGEVSTIQDVALLEKWAQYIVGLSDFQLGKEMRSRTPATTTTSLIEEANIRPNRVVDVMRNQMRKQHKQVLTLYMQNASPEKLDEMAQVAAVEPEDVELFKQAWMAVDPADLMDAIIIDPDVSANSLNRQARRQEAMALFAQYSGFNDRINQLMQLIGGSIQDPMARNVFLAQAEGYVRLMKRVLDTFEERDQRQILPVELLKLLEGVTSVQVEGGGATAEGTNQPSPAQAAQGLTVSEGPAAGPVAPENRPIAGQPRVPIGAGANGGYNG